MPAVEPRIVRLGAADIERVLHLWRRAGLPFRSEGRDAPAAIAQELATGRSFLLGAFAGGDLAGVALGTDDGRKGWVNRVAVLPEHRRSGLARRLVDACEELFRERGLGLSCCLVEQDNDASLALFADAGYEERRDIVYLRKPLGPDSY